MSRNQTPLEKYTSELVRIFKRTASKHEAHQQSGRVLLDMAGDRSCLRAALAAELNRPGALNARHFPSVGIPVEHNAYFQLVANCFLPLPSGETDITTNSIHHHGHLLLTTVTTFGPGYEHWRFTTPRPIDSEREMFSIELIDRETHGPNHTAFVDSFMPHAVIYPGSLTVTFALWSSRNEIRWLDHLKRMRALEVHRERLRNLVNRFRFSEALGLNPEIYFDFHPVDDGFKGMRERVQFKRGPNEDYLQTFFHILQRTSNEDLAPDEELFSRVPINNPGLVKRLAGDLRRGVPIAGRFSEGLHWLDHMNFKIEKINQALGALKGKTTQLRDMAAIT